MYFIEKKAMASFHDWLTRTTLTGIMTNRDFLIDFLWVFTVGFALFCAYYLISNSNNRYAKIVKETAVTIWYGALILVLAANVVGLLFNWKEKIVMMGKGGGAPVNHWVALVINGALLVSLTVLFWDRIKNKR